MELLTAVNIKAIEGTNIRLKRSRYIILVPSSVRATVDGGAGLTGDPKFEYIYRVVITNRSPSRGS